MARDNQGNDLGAIDVQLTGFAAINFNATTAPTLAELAGNSIPTGYEYLGLFLEDGGYAEESEAGDLTYFFQQGYSLRTGDQSITGKLVPAEDNDTVWKLTGIDENVRKDIAYDGSFGLIIATQFKNGNIVARGGMAHVTEVAPSAEARGEINSIEITFEWEYSTEYDGYYRICRAGDSLTDFVTEITEKNYTFNNNASIANAIISLPNINDGKSPNATTNNRLTVTTGDMLIYSFKVRKTTTNDSMYGRFRLRIFGGDSSQTIIELQASGITDSFVEYSGSATVAIDTSATVDVRNQTPSGTSGGYEVKDIKVKVGGQKP